MLVGGVGAPGDGHKSPQPSWALFRIINGLSTPFSIPLTKHHPKSHAITSGRW